MLIDSITQKVITVLNLYAPTTKAPKYGNQQLRKNRKNKITVITGEFNILLLQLKEELMK